MPRIDAVIFDLDCTLIHSAPELLRSANAYLETLGRPPLDLPELRGFIGNGVPKLVSRLRTARGMPQTGRPDVARFLELYQAAPVGQTTLFPGVAAALETLARAGIPMGICTNKPEAPTRVILEHFGIAQHFPSVVGGDTLPVFKPDPAPLRRGMEELHAREILFVGDSDVDCATAQATGQPCALYTEGYRKSPPEALPHLFAFSDYAAFTASVLSARSQGVQPSR